MHIETIGDGPDLVLIHGWAMHAGIFAPLTDRLAGSFRLHLVDLPGHGLSPERDSGFDPVESARRLLAALPRAIWCGWSLGGLVCLHAALQSPQQVRALALVASSPRFVVGDDWPHGVDPAIFRQFADGLRHDYHRTIERFLALETLGSDHAKAELRTLKQHVFERGEPSLAVLCDGLDVLDRTDLRARLAELAMPNAWIAGRRDRLIPAGAMQWAAQAAHGRYVETPAGHAPFIAHADLVADAISALDTESPA